MLEQKDISVPQGWAASVPDEADVPDLTSLLRAHEKVAKGSPSASEAVIEADVTGKNADACEHVAVRDSDGLIRGWASVHDRAAGRVLGAVTIDPALAAEVADPLAAELIGWTQRKTIEIGRDRGLERNQLDCGAFATDERQQRWHESAGLTHVRSWWQMGRPVEPHEGEPGALPPAKDEVEIRLVRRGEDQMPESNDLHAVHDVLESAFLDHFNSHEETFDEFLARLRADPGHRWDHWWIAELIEEVGEQQANLAAGALVATVSENPGRNPNSSYVAYIGVLESARGHGVGTALLNEVIADAARRGRSHVTLEVDADSPTGADELYLSMGFTTDYTTQSWHQYFDVPASS